MDMRDVHIGIQVPDLDHALSELNALLGLDFADPLELPVTVQVGGEIERCTGRFTLSRSGPPYLEVTENVPGSRIWTTPGEDMAVHHVGFWVDDVAHAAARFTEAGYPVEAAGLTEDGRYRYTYHRLGDLRIELCAAAARDAFERWARTGNAGGVGEEFLQSHGSRSENPS
ncbi:VOC family protein [Planosporangium thailandense]|uniref:VOC family protein n=1 Tax=Planosporangium thailandense TaxID=765197 RepID=A0ABX0XVF8_9ACTN|nr:VOC family protein [Planosporangium thailandense]NJC69230.1 VOC family protein [Planosporangium thailandense]